MPKLHIESARCVLENARPTLVPLSVTVETYLRRAHLDRLRQAGSLAQLIARQAEAFAVEYDNERQHGRTCAGLPDDIINFQHDPLACAIALGWRDGIEIDELPLRIEMKDGWLHQSIAEDGAPMQVVTRVDGERFSNLWLNIVARTASFPNT
jgi:inosine-uridine nucleoside N-ribohydrolase